MGSTLRLLPAFAVAGLLAGCATHHPQDNFAQAVAMGERPVAMAGSATFFDGSIKATVTISRGIGGGEHGGGTGGGGGGHHRHGSWNSDEQSPDVSSMDTADAEAYLRARAEIGSPMPPVTIHLKLENLGGQTCSVDISDFESYLGNFAVTPEVLAMAPSQVAEPDPMISQMGVTSDTIPIKVTLKLGSRQETQTIAVRSLLAKSNSSP